MSDIIKPSILPGFMELLPEDQIVFNQLKSIIEETFKKYCFLPIDTPVIEKGEILFAKGGGETQKQIYKIDKGEKNMALRFDLTVPLARYVAMHSNEINFPFRRYHIGKVYRGERNQKGRFREFYQCDIDIIGNETLSLYNDAEIPAVIYEIFQRINFSDVTIHMSNRKLINGIIESIGIDNSEDALRAIDKLAKIGRENVVEELASINIDGDQAEKLLNIISFEGSNEETFKHIKSMTVTNDNFREGLAELELVYDYMKKFGIPDTNIKIDLKITRGLDYYTGTVYETFLNGYESIGSVCSGGRYENLASNFTTKRLPGIGLSIGLTRLYYQLNEIEAFKNFCDDVPKTSLILPMSGYEDQGIELINELRKEGVVAHIYLEPGKIKKKFSFADNLKFRYVVIIGEDEVAEGNFTLKDMMTGEQQKISKKDLTQLLK